VKQENTAKTGDEVGSYIKIKPVFKLRNDLGFYDQGVMESLFVSSAVYLDYG